jgi:hypothetical protein
MAHLVRPQKTFYVDADGRRVPKDTPGATKRTVKASKWYGQGIPGHPPKKRFPLATDKAVAKRMLADLVRGAERGHAQLPSLDASRRPLSEHLTAFENAVSLGLTDMSFADAGPLWARPRTCPRSRPIRPRWTSTPGPTCTRWG